MLLVAHHYREPMTKLQRFTIVGCVMALSATAVAIGAGMTPHRAPAPSTTPAPHLSTP